MKFKLYYFIFIFLNILCILSIKFKARKFSSPKYLRMKSFLIVLISFLISVEQIYIIFMSLFNHPEKIVEISKFAIYFTSVFLLLSNVSTTIWMLILVIKQETIAKLFTIFLDFKNFCDEKKFKINYEKIRIKTLRTFCLFLSLSLISVIFFKNLSTFNIIDIFKTILILFKLIFYRLSFWLFYIILIHFEFLIDNLNDILESQFSLHKHCESLFQNMMKMKIIFNLLNQGFGLIFSINVLIEFLFVISCVSRTI